MHTESDQTYIKVRLLYIFEEDGNRVLARFGMVDIANSM
jgi:hypothetical protein